MHFNQSANTNNAIESILHNFSLKAKETAIHCLGVCVRARARGRRAELVLVKAIAISRLGGTATFTQSPQQAASLGFDWFVQLPRRLISGNYNLMKIIQLCKLMKMSAQFKPKP